ncbi:MAG: hypothetical protein QOI12_1321 [Alphaproteobacteria bacterium]|jgi:membrane associated rhomboid family serine protease|nr:hypothetical protein [Alphaproteobacteria bacterium]
MVMPLYDDNPFKLPHRPVVSWGLIAANFIFFVMEFGADGSAQDSLMRFGVMPAAFAGEVGVAGALPPTLTLFTYMFLHADIGHIFGNMIFLWVFGDNVEEALGRWRFLAFYLATGVLAALAFVASDVHSQTPLIGASGAIAGVVIAYVMLRPCAKITVLVSIIPLRVSAYWVVGLFVLLQFVNLGSASKSEIAYWCHIGGMVAGGILFVMLRPPGVMLFECIRAPKVPVVADAGDPPANRPWG